MEPEERRIRPNRNPDGGIFRATTRSITLRITLRIKSSSISLMKVTIHLDL